MKNLEQRQKEVLENYKKAKANYLKDMSNENWKLLCIETRNCSLLGVRILISKGELYEI